MGLAIVNAWQNGLFCSHVLVIVLCGMFFSLICEEMEG